MNMERHDLSQFADLKEIEDLAAQKESEWRSLSNLQIKTLREDLENKTKAHSELYAKFTKLKEDFKYNLKVSFCDFSDDVLI